MKAQKLNSQESRLRAILEKQEWTPGDKEWLLNYLETADGEELQMIMQRLFEEQTKQPAILDQHVSKKLLEQIHDRVETPGMHRKPRVVALWLTRVAAACIIGLLAMGGWWMYKQQNNQQVQTAQQQPPAKIVPGKDKAILTLADGSTIVLDDAGNGALAQQGNTRIIKLNGKLDYNAATASTEVMYNTLSTPRGGKFQVELADGTQVWLNAESSLRFPTSFVGAQRKVEITGEAYFEVAHNKQMPFVVKVNDAEVQVLGTHFNVMAYTDEASVKTTLLEGSVRFVKGTNTSTLTPGQQSQLLQNGQVKVVSGVNVDDVVAWKNGHFSFNGKEIDVIVRELARWYDLQVQYQGNIDDLFYAQIPRSTNLNDVLKALELTGKVHFEIKGRKIIVKP